MADLTDQGYQEERGTHEVEESRRAGRRGTARSHRGRACPQSQQDKGTLKIGIELPLSGGEVANGEPTQNGVLLAIQQANAAGGVGGYQLADNTQDDAVDGAPMTRTRVHCNIGTLVADPTVVGVVGPFNSSVARARDPGQQ